jgi:hypothetical protein
MDNTDEVKSETILPKKVKVEYDGYYLVESVTNDGRKTVVPARGYNLKSWFNFEKSLSMNISVEYHQVLESEYMKYHWSTHGMAEDDDIMNKNNIKSAGKGNRQPVFPKKPLKPKKPIKTIAKTDRNIGDITAFME